MLHSSNIITRIVSDQKRRKRRLQTSAIGLLFAMIAGSMVGCREEGRSVARQIELVEARSIDHIVFYRGLSDDSKLYVMRADGTGQTCVEKKPWADMYNPLRSPDGRKLARQGSRGWYIVSVEEAEVLPAGGYYVGQSPWSPDSRRFAFFNRAGIHVIDAGTGETARLTENSADVFPAWSPDGKKIAFASKRDGNWKIYVMNGDGTQQARLTKSPNIDNFPAWSPNGTKIAFERSRLGENGNIWVMSADGSARTQLTNSLHTDTRPAWSSDGTRIVFERYRGLNNPEIYIMSADGTRQINLTRNRAWDADPAWWTPNTLLKERAHQ